MPGKVNGNGCDNQLRSVEQVRQSEPPWKRVNRAFRGCLMPRGTAREGRGDQDRALSGLRGPSPAPRANRKPLCGNKLRNWPRPRSPSTSSLHAISSLEPFRYWSSDSWNRNYEPIKPGNAIRSFSFRQGDSTRKLKPRATDRLCYGHCGLFRFVALS